MSVLGITAAAHTLAILSVVRTSSSLDPTWELPRNATPQALSLPSLLNGTPHFPKTAWGCMHRERPRQGEVSRHSQCTPEGGSRLGSHRVMPWSWVLTQVPLTSFNHGLALQREVIVGPKSIRVTSRKQTAHSDCGLITKV